MIDAREVRQQLKKIKELAADKANSEKAAPALQQLHSIVFDDLSKTGDQRVRLLMALLRDFKLDIK